MNPRVVKAIFSRNFHSYFNNPTGFVFMGLFVVLTSMAAIWPDEFFASNLANLNTLNARLPYILLIFIPAITMAVWADERRQGTDELLLTIPATDLDVVLGKYLAAVAVYSVSLLFSLFCNLFVLETLGAPDIFLFLSNYVGYWMVGLAMLATGMVASFFTGNLTVAFILGVIFNAPLVLADWADSITSTSEFSAGLKHWGLAEQFRDFGRGVISLDSIVYFLGIVVVMLYLSLVLIGRRHWMGGRDGQSLLGHYLLRALALAVIMVALNMLVGTVDAHWGLHYDLTAERTSSLSPDTIELMRNLDTKNRPVVIEAFVSPNVPEAYVQTRLNLLNDLREFERLGDGRVQVKIVPAEPNTKEATDAEKQFNIKPQTVNAKSRGAYVNDQIFMGVAVTCGLEKVVVPFFDPQMSVEYELIRSICTAAQQKRKRLGIVTTDANLYGGIDMMAIQMGQMRTKPRQPIVDELEKQYDVVQVDPNKPIEKFDVLLAVQPSSLGQIPMMNLINAIKAGQPTAIFEDPFPWSFDCPGTSDEKQPPMGMMGQMPGQGQKGDMQPLWDFLGVEMVARKMPDAFGPKPSQAMVVWQDYIANPRLRGLGLPRELVFVGRDEPGAGKTAINDNDSISSNLQELWFPFPGALMKLNKSQMKFVPLIVTGNRTGTISPRELRRLGGLDSRTALEAKENENVTAEQYTLAAHITGESKSADADDKPADSEKKDTDKKDADKKDADKKDADSGEHLKSHKTHPINVVVVADIDLMGSQVFALRSRAQDDDPTIGELRFDNIPFVLNVLDSLSGDSRFVEIRKRRPAHRTLTVIEHQVDDNRDAMIETRKEFKKKYDDQKQAAQAIADKASAKLQELQDQMKKYQAKGEEPPPAVQQQYLEAMMNAEIEINRVQDKIKQLDRDERREEEIANRNLNSQIKGVQDRYKYAAALIPPIIPIIIAAFVFFNRRAEEREGVAKSRLR